MEPGGGGWVVALAVSPHESNRLLSSGDMLSAALSTDRGKSWEPVFGFSSYEMCDITWHPADPNTVWIGSMTGPYVSTDGGKNWQSRRIGMPEKSHSNYSCPIEKILFDPSDSRRLLAFSGTSRHWGNVNQFRGIWESTDCGASWKSVGNLAPDSAMNIYRAVFAGGASRTLYAVADTVWVSRDMGKSWERCCNGLPPAQIGSIQAHPTDSKTLWVSVKAYQGEDGIWLPGGIYKTVDGGANWLRSSTGLTQDSSAQEVQASSYPSLAVSPKNPDILWTGDSSYSRCLIYKSEDGGASWKAVAKKGDKAGTEGAVAIVPAACFAGSGMTGFAADPSDENAVFCWCSEYTLCGTDGGKSWFDAASERPAGKTAPFWKGRGWTGWCSRNIAFNPYRENQCILQGMDACRGWLTDDNFKSYRYVSTDPVPWMAGNDASFTSDGRIYIATGQFGGFAGILCSRDFGASFTVSCGDACGLPGMSWGGANAECTGIYANPDDSPQVWAALGGRLYYSADSGESWKVINDNSGLTTIAGNPLKAGTFYAAGRDCVYFYDGGGLRNIGGPSPAGRGRLNCDSLGRLYACQFRDGNSGLWRYSPARQSWDKLLDEPLAIQCAVDPANPDRLLLVTSQDPYNDFACGNGLWVSCDAGKSWSAENSGLPMMRCNSAAFNPFDHEQIVAGTYGAGFYTARWPQDYKPQGTRK